MSFGINYLKFDSKGSNDATSDDYEIDLLKQWLASDITMNHTVKIHSFSSGIGLKLYVNDRLDFNLSTVRHNRYRLH